MTVASSLFVASDESECSAMADIAENVSTNVKVVVRVRPRNELEANGQQRSVVEIVNENVLVFDPKDVESPSFGQRGRRHRDIRKRRQKDMKFAFDYVFGATSTNEEVFRETTNCVLDGLLSGYNCSVFAYGATGAGKTHTMLGSEMQPGVIYHTMIQLYRRIGDINQDKTCDVAVSYLEVYNEQIRDLLRPHGTLPIREDRNAGVLIPGLSLHKPSNAEELLHMLHFGNKNRTQHPTDANAESSRSHAVFQVFVRQRDRTANISAEVKVAKMCLVDLAGSERATVTKNRGARFREGANINRSLLALGNVINALADQKYKGHIPYRDSKLTRLLKDSLGGNCRTIMIAAISPSNLSYEDTYNTLKYADRAKNIRLNIKKNVLNVDFHVSRYGKIVEDLRREIAELKQKLQEYEAPKIGPSFLLAMPGDIQSLREKLQVVYAERRSVRDQQLRQETSLRDTQWRLHRKQKCLQRTSQFTFMQPELQKIQGTIHGLQQKLLGQEVHRQTLSSRLQDNTQSLTQLHTQALTHDTRSSAISQLMELSVHKLGLEVELNDSRHYIRHLRRLARAQEREAMVSERLITALLKLVQRQQNELRCRGTVPVDITESYQNVCDLVGECGVSWADDDGDQAPFHINSIIDIPLVSHSGPAGDRVPSLALPAPTTTISSALVSAGAATTNSKLAPALTCPGRAVNGQVVYSSPAPSISIQPCAVNPEPPATKLQATTLSDFRVSGQLGTSGVTAESNGLGGVTAGEDLANPASTMNTGHTPTPQKSAHPPCSSHAVLSNHGRKSAAESGSKPHGLNETFSLEESAKGMDVNATLDLNGPSVFNVPVIDASRSPSAKTLQRKNTPFPSKQTLTCLANNNVSLQTNRSNGLQGETVNGQNSRTVPSHLTQSSRAVTAFANSGLSSSSGDSNSLVDSGTVTKMLPSIERRPIIETVTKSRPTDADLEDKENDPSQRQHSNVARSINFDGVVSSPMRVQGRSYADAVKTPSPPRQPLQALDCNSPQLSSNSLPSASGQTPKEITGGGRQSLYLAGPQALDNIRKLKQFGMPSLVENLVMGSKSVSSLSGPSTIVPSYMQPTKSVAQRVRLQLKPSWDDSFHPKRVPRNLSHNRSKSVTSLSRVGWKI